MQLTRKLTFFIAIAVWSVLGVVACLRIAEERSLYRDDLRRDHEVLGHALAAAVSEAWRVSGRDVARDVVAHATSADSPVSVRWLDADVLRAEPGLAASVADELKAGVMVHTLFENSTEPQLISLVPLRPGKDAPFLELRESLSSENRYLGRTLSHTVVATLAVGAVCTALAFLLGTWMVGRPVRALRDKARRVGTGDLTVPVVLTQRDELGDLAREMNHMSDALARSRAEREAANAERIRALSQLRHAERLATVGRLAAGVAHELGTPLHVIEGHTKLLDRGEAESEEETRESLQTILRQTARMTHIVRQLLDFARARTPHKTPVDLRAIAEEATSMLTALAAQRDVNVQVEGEGCVVHADESQMLQVATNLLKNAIDASSPGQRVTLEVSTAHADDGPRGVLRVVDQGSGIDPEAREHLFEPFFTTKDVGRGTGLGLAVSHGIVLDHGGAISVDCPPRGGSVFEVQLPQEAQ
ncbi:MAG: HAMP domain-containing sensor histidine kinase [Polyangiaceae bacterium]